MTAEVRREFLRMLPPAVVAGWPPGEDTPPSLALLAALQEQWFALAADVDSILDDAFPDSAADWALPYLAALLGLVLVAPASSFAAAADESAGGTDHTTELMSGLILVLMIGLVVIGRVLFGIQMPDRIGSLVLALLLGAISFCGLGIGVTSLIRSADLNADLKLDMQQQVLDAKAQNDLNEASAGAYFQRSGCGSEDPLGHRQARNRPVKDRCHGIVDEI